MSARVTAAPDAVPVATAGRSRGLLVIFPHDYLTTIPTMPQAFDALLAHFPRIDLLCKAGDIRVERPGAPLDKAAPHGILNPFRTWRFAGQLMRRMAAALLRLVRRRYAAIIAIDPEGITIADRLNRDADLPLAYISFEILCKADCSTPAEHELKRLEVDASRKAEVILIQDEERGAAMAADNGIEPGRFVYVPVAPYPSAIRRETWLRERCGIPEDQTIVLLSGTIDAWTSRDLLPEIVRGWPEGFALVIHNRQQGHARIGAFLAKLAAHPRVYTTDEYLDQQDLPRLYGSADIGFVPYLPNPVHWGSHLNTLHMGFASGKVGYFAMCGVPLLTSDLPVYRREFAEYRAGYCYSAIAEIPELLVRIRDNRALHASESRRFYDERLNPQRGIAAFARRMAEIRDE